MSSYKVYCNECTEEFLVNAERAPQYCCMCGEEVAEVDINNEDAGDEFGQNEWDRISREELDDVDDWKMD